MKVLSGLIVILMSVATISVAADKLSMQVFYGSLCGDSINFIQNQVYPLYTDIKDYVQITFVPFGKGNSSIDDNGTISFFCSYDLEGCSISRIQLCAIDYLDQDEDAIMNFVRCQMAHQSDRTGETCATRSNIPFHLLTECVNSQSGIELQLQAEKTTKNFRDPLTWLPTIGFNWSYVDDLSHRAETDLKEVICELLNDAAPVCSGLYYKLFN